MSEAWTHTFKTPLGLEHLKSLLAKACRHPYSFEVEAHDFNVIPAYRIIEARFATVEDRDRVRVVLRQLEKEMMAAAKANPRRPPDNTQGVRASAPIDPRNAPQTSDLRPPSTRNPPR